MARSIDRILKKKGWSGADVGKALVACVAHDLKHQDEPDFKPLFTQADLDNMVSSLQTERDHQIYGCYASIYSSVLDTFNRGQAMYQQFFHAYYRCANAMMLCEQADDVLKQSRNLPLLMTQSQYDRVWKKAKQRLNALDESYVTLAIHTIEYFYKNPRKAPEPIKKALRDAKKAPVTNQRLLDMYNQATGNGYYTLPDGRRSDEMELAEWQRIILTPYFTGLTAEEQAESINSNAYQQAKKNGFLKVCEMFFKGMDGVRATYKEMYGEDTTELDALDEATVMETLAEMVGRAGDDIGRRANAVAPRLPLKGLLKRIAEKVEYISPVWHYYEEPPKGLTKYDFLEEAFDTWYSGIYDGLLDDDEATKETTLTEFVADYPDLYKAVTEYMAEKIPAIKDIEPSQIWDVAVYWDELARLNYLDFKEKVEPDDLFIINTMNEENLLPGSPSAFERAICNSIAIVKNPHPHQLDENGDFVEQAESIVAKTVDLERTVAKERRAGELRILRENLLYPAVRYICSFNVLMDIVSERYDIEHLDALKLDISCLEERMTAFNNVLYLFYADVYGEQEEVAHKRELIKELFVPLELADFMPTQEAVDAVTAQIYKLDYSNTSKKILGDLDAYIKTLSGRGK